MTQRALSIALALLAMAILVPSAGWANSTQILISHGLVSQDVGDGADLFFRETFDGNGRTCASCHPQDNNQTLDAEFIATLPSSDPLFIAEKPASQGGVPGLEIPVLMRQFGLMLENPDGTEDPTVKFVMRGVPHSLSMSTSIQAPIGFPFPEAPGWGGDGGLDGTLLNFPAGAAKQHFTKTLARGPGDFREPTPTELFKMDQFMLKSGRLNELTLTNVSLAEPDADMGRLIFLNDGSNTTLAAGKCNVCHANAGANVNYGDGANHNFDVGVEEVIHPARAVVNFPFDGGLGKELNEEGTFGDGTFNTPPLVEAADTAPFFHNNVIEGLEDAVAFFSGPEFNASPGATVVGGINLTPDESDQVAAFLRVVNAGFNLAMSIQRNNAGVTLENSSNKCSGGGGTVASPQAQTTSGGGNCTNADGGGGTFTPGKRETINMLLALSNAEAADAVEVLSARGLNPTAVSLIQSAISKNLQAINETSSSLRKSLMQSAVFDLNQAKGQLGTGLNFVMGEGNLLF